MIRAVDSCSWTNTEGSILKYQSQLFGFGYELQPGRSGGKSYFAFNCDAIYTLPLDTQRVWRNSFSFYVGPLNDKNGPAEVNIWGWNAGVSTTLATIALVASAANPPYSPVKGARLRIYQGGDGHHTLGALLYTSQTILAQGQWYSIDIDWSFPASGTGFVSLYINDILDTLPAYPGGPSINAVNWSGFAPDRFSMIMINGGGSGSGWQICDSVVSDGKGDVNNARLGPCQVDFLIFSADQLIQWGAPLPKTLSATVDAISEYPGHYPTGDHNAPDEDASYISTAASGVTNFYSLSGISCYAQILGVALTCTLRDPMGGAIDLVCRWSPPMGASSDVVVGGTGGSFGAVSPLAYATVQGISEVDPTSSTFPWLDGHIQNAWWGVRCLSGNPFVTQLFLEKVTSRRAVPYTCGFQGNTAQLGSS